MTEFENEEKIQQGQDPEDKESTQLGHEASPAQPATILKDVWAYLLKFIKAPITTLKNVELDPKGAAILVAILPIASFLSTWSLIRGVVTSITNTMSGLGGITGNLAGVGTRELRAEILADVSWGSIFFNGLLATAIWFALMMFTPLLVAKLFKNTQTVDMKNLFSQMAVITIPISLLYLAATIVGFISPSLWFLLAVASAFLPSLFHFFVVRQTLNETPDKAFYITFITQVIILFVAGLWLNVQITGLTGGLFG